MKELLSEWYAWDNINYHLYPVEAWVKEEGILNKVIIYGIWHDLHDFSYFEVNLN